ncbi:MAG TPA: RNA polymerase subunit sigma-70 [Planctomycetaceae bacterium]|nr:RNA polymerase subunit sigma-70 [Planctomycetaceae bacterium]
MSDRKSETDSDLEFDSQPAELVENFFRHESARMVATLTRTFGVHRMQLIEDCIQTALVEAMRSWRHGVPKNPAGWVHRVAKNRVLDALRRDATHQKALAFAHLDQQSTDRMVDESFEESQIEDSLLRMIFVCCHPLLDPGSQVAITLKTLCGFSIDEIASGLLLPSETVKKRVQRARKKLAEADISTDLPRDDELHSRVSAVHNVLYLMFNEGYSASGGESVVRDDICEEATRLCYLLCHSPFARPDSKALLALHVFHAARLGGRMDDSGSSVLLEDQDRSLWDQRLIAIAKHWLQLSRTNTPSRFHFEAAIAQEHCVAESFDATDWTVIVRCYDRLIDLYDSPVYRLNRAIAIAHNGQPQQALEQLLSLKSGGQLESYQLLDCVLGRINEMCGNIDVAIQHYESFLASSIAPHQRRLVEARLASFDRR